MIDTSTLRSAMREIALQRGEFTLFALFKRSDALGTWDLVVSAPWLDEDDWNALGEFTQLLGNHIGEEQLKELARVVTLDTSDPALNAVLAAVSVDDGEVRLQRPNFFGLEIEDALILRSKRAA